jgi:hypothetical protein
MHEWVTKALKRALELFFTSNPYQEESKGG